MLKNVGEDAELSLPATPTSLSSIWHGWHGALPLSVSNKAVLRCFFPLRASAKVWQARQVQEPRARASFVRAEVCEALLRFCKSVKFEKLKLAWEILSKLVDCTQIRFQVQSFSTSHNPSSQSSKQNAKFCFLFCVRSSPPTFINLYQSVGFAKWKSSKTKNLSEESKKSSVKSVSLKDSSLSRSWSDEVMKPSATPFCTLKGHCCTSPARFVGRDWYPWR